MVSAPRHIQSILYEEAQSRRWIWWWTGNCGTSRWSRLLRKDAWSQADRAEESNPGQIGPRKWVRLNWNFHLSFPIKVYTRSPLTQSNASPLVHRQGHWLQTAFAEVRCSSPSRLLARNWWANFWVRRDPGRIWYGGAWWLTRFSAFKDQCRPTLLPTAPHGSDEND